MLYPFKDVCIMGAKGNKVNREKTWLREIFALVKVFFQLVEFGFNATYHRHILTGPEQFCEDCLFLVGVFPARPFFLAFSKAGDSLILLFSHRLFFNISLDRIVLRWRPTRAVQRGSRQVQGVWGLTLQDKPSPLPVF